MSWAPSAGVLVFLGVGRDDGETHCTYLANKIIHLRIFEDKEGFTNLSLGYRRGGTGAFPIHPEGRLHKGRRPSFAHAARPEMVKTLYAHFIHLLEAKGVHMETGGFQVIIDVSLINDGPVTFMIDSRKAF